VLPADGSLESFQVPSREVVGSVEGGPKYPEEGSPLRAYRRPSPRRGMCAEPCSASAQSSHSATSPVTPSAALSAARPKLHARPPASQLPADDQLRRRGCLIFRGARTASSAPFVSARGPRSRPRCGRSIAWPGGGARARECWRAGCPDREVLKVVGGSNAVSRARAGVTEFVAESPVRSGGEQGGQRT
jgi:hypothetical protein